jgi:hypothetical protein
MIAIIRPESIPLRDRPRLATICVFNHFRGTARERIASCEVAIDPNHSLFRPIRAGLAAAGAGRP